MSNLEPLPLLPTDGTAGAVAKDGEGNLIFDQHAQDHNDERNRINSVPGMYKGGLHTPRAIGFYHTFGTIDSAQSVNGTVLEQHRLMGFPISTPEQVSVDSLFVFVHAAGEADSIIRWGIYDAGPGSLLADCGSMVVDSIGYKTLTFAPLPLSPGGYLLACWTTASTASLRIPSIPTGLDVLGVASATNSSGFAKWIDPVNTGYGSSLPAAWVDPLATSTGASRPHFRLRRSA